MNFYTNHKKSKLKFQAGSVLPNSGFQEDSYYKNFFPDVMSRKETSALPLSDDPVKTASMGEYLAVSGSPGNVKPIISDANLLQILDDKLENAKQGKGIEELQRELKVVDDDIWGPKSQKAFDNLRRELYLNTVEGREEDSKIKYIQEHLGVRSDGIWGRKTQDAYKIVTNRQNTLGVSEDGIWGKESQAAQDELTNSLSRPIKALYDEDMTSGLLAKRAQPLEGAESRKARRDYKRKIRKAKRVSRKEARENKKLEGGGLFY
jgi:hypothetical protein